MNVQEVIDELMKIEDKTKKVFKGYWVANESGTAWDCHEEVHGIIETQIEDGYQRWVNGVSL